MSGEGLGREIGIKGDDPVHIRFGNIERLGQSADRCRRDVSVGVLDVVQDRQKRAFIGAASVNQVAKIAEVRVRHRRLPFLRPQIRALSS